MSDSEDEFEAIFADDGGASHFSGITIEHKKAKRLTYDDIVVQAKGDPANWFRSFWQTEVNNTIVWPVSPQRQDRLAALCKNLTDFHATAYPQLVDKVLNTDTKPSLVERLVHFMVATVVKSGRKKKPEELERSSVQQQDDDDDVDDEEAAGNDSQVDLPTTYAYDPTLQYMKYSSLTTIRWDLLCLVKYSATPRLTSSAKLQTDLYDAAVKIKVRWHLRRKTAKSLLLGRHEIRLLIEDMVAHGDHPDLLCQDQLLYLIYHYTMARPGSLLTTRSYPSNYIRWRDIEVYRRLSKTEGGAEGEGLTAFLGWDVVVTLCHLKGHQFVDDLNLRMSYRPTGEVLTDLGVAVLSHAYRSGQIDDLESLLASPADQANSPLKLTWKNPDEPVFLARKSRAGLNIESIALSDHAARVRLIQQCVRAGLVAKGERITSYGFRKSTATELSTCKYIGSDQTRRAMGHGTLTDTLERIYDQSLETRDFAGAIVGEEALEMGIYSAPYISAGFKVASLSDIIKLDPQCINLGKYIAACKHALATGDIKPLKALPMYKDGRSFDPAHELASFATTLKARISDLQRNPPIDTETMKTWAEHRDIYEKFRKPSPVPERLAKKLKQHEDQMIKDRTRQGVRHLPTIITIEMEIPGEEEEVEEGEVVQETDADGDTQGPVSAGENLVGEVGAKNTSKISTSGKSSTGDIRVDGKADTVAITALKALSRNTEAKLVEVLPEKLMMLKGLATMPTKILDETCPRCMEEENISQEMREKLYNNKALRKHIVETAFHTPGSRYWRWLEANYPEAIRADGAGKTKVRCPFCAKGSKLLKPGEMEEHVATRHYETIPHEHELFFKMKYFAYQPTRAERQVLGRDAYKPRGGQVQRDLREDTSLEVDYGTSVLKRFVKDEAEDGNREAMEYKLEASANRRGAGWVGQIDSWW
ncbi:hypothetical protein HD553DRAFT_312540 [Filobasidium floriforme]|uniref:uncharacterized protein n=1 Tax=Filobasidium floriforme TaxID=5210 RepID=UPI001E8D4CF8|nr:uncharacterized protein HD553DRAFT_312540 [Filobasidium floriforme]KAH8083505.1 hypothetical protein HD553DRAFT_312540 [Filobasidium floriforme]